LNQTNQIDLIDQIDLTNQTDQAEWKISWFGGMRLKLRLPGSASISPCWRYFPELVSVAIINKRS